MNGAAATTLFGLARREARVRWVSLALSAAGVALGVAALTAAAAALRAYDRATEAVQERFAAATAAGLERYDTDLRQAMLHLGFTLVILPAEQDLGDFYADGYATATLPADSARVLAAAKLLTVGRFLPVLRRKVRWEERGWTVLVQAVGAPQGTAAGSDHPEVRLVPPGSVDLGYEIHRGLQLAAGDRVQFQGAAFAVRDCRPETGSVDDLTVWMDLAEAQERFGLQGRLSEIQALECRTAWNQPARIRAEIAKALPGLTVIEKRGETQTLAAAREAFEQSRQRRLEQTLAARQEQRAGRRRLARAAVTLALAFAAGSSGLAAWNNARERRPEMALWTALGSAPAQVAGLLLWRAVLACGAGAMAGVAAGALWWGWPGLGTLLVWAVCGLAAAAAVALPATLAAVVLGLRFDPAAVLKNEV